MSAFRCWISLIVLLYAVISHAEDRVISGVVVNDSGAPLPTVIVKATDGGGKVYHSMTGANGKFTISADTTATELELRFSRLGYETVIRRVALPSREITVEMQRASVMLREVTVKAPSVMVKGDTIFYNLADFADKGDVTLQDALAKVPGVEVKENGGIKYNGKDISNFYINGMELLGGKYNIATTSIPHTYVNTVEVLNNHEDKKIQRGIFNDNVAMNIRLSPKAMFKPMGKYEAEAGYGDRLLGQASGAGMMFTDNFQTILTLKGGNIREFAAYDNNIHYDSDRTTDKSSAEKILGEMTSGNPPIGRDRWVDPLDVSTSLNCIQKFTPDVSLRLNAGYEYAHTEYDYSETATYFGGETDIRVDRTTSPETSTHRPSLSMQYLINSDQRYLRNTLHASAGFVDRHTPVAGNRESISQSQNLTTYDISDFFYLSAKRGKTLWSYSASLRYKDTPTGRIEVERDADEKAWLAQTARSNRLSTSHTLSGRIEMRRSSLQLPLSVSLDHEHIVTALDNHGFGHIEIQGISNNLRGTDFKIRFAPKYEYASAFNRLVIRVGMPVGLNVHNWKNHGSEPSSHSHPLLSIDPNFYLNYELSVKSTLQGSVDYHDSHGDIMNMLTAPVMTDYMSMQLRSGILSHTRTLTSRLHYGFKSPLTMWNGRANVQFTRRWNNLTTGQYVSSGLIAVTSYLIPNGHDSFSADMGISKRMASLRTNVSLDGSWRWTRSLTEQNSLRVRHYRSIYTVTPKITSSALEWLEVSYALNLSFNTTRYLNTSHSYTSQDHSLKMKFYPHRRCELNLNTNIARKEIASGVYKTMALFDAGAVVKHKSLRFGLKLHNLLNTRRYTYTILNGLDSYTYSYGLRGRQYLLSVTFVK